MTKFNAYTCKKKARAKIMHIDIFESHKNANDKIYKFFAF